MAARDDLPVEVAMRLAKDPDDQVRKALHDGQSLPELGAFLRLPTEVAFALWGRNGTASANSALLKEVTAGDLMIPVTMYQAPRLTIRPPVLWRAAEDRGWAFVHAGRPGRVELPYSIDGFFQILQGPTPHEAYAWGRLSPDGKRFIDWAVPCQTGGTKVDKLPEIAFRYAYAIPAKGVQADLVGQAIVGFGMYALWRSPEGLVGWTEERSAESTPRQRKLYRGQLVPEYLAPVFTQLEMGMRLIGYHGLGL
jgi:hypothetical protein